MEEGVPAEKGKIRKSSLQIHTFTEAKSIWVEGRSVLLYPEAGRAHTLHGIHILNPRELVSLLPPFFNALKYFANFSKMHFNPKLSAFMKNEDSFSSFLPIERIYKVQI